MSHIFVLIGSGLLVSSWDYSEGGDDWDGICSSGKLQSPVDLTDSVITKTTSEQDLITVEFDLVGEFSSAFTYSSDGNFLLSYSLGSLIINSKEVVVGNIHFHSPSESKINGKQYDLEMHLYGNDADSVGYEIAILFEVTSTSNKFIQASIDSYSKSKNQDFDTEWLVTNGIIDNYYYYPGSLSGPIFGDCYENTNWLVLGDILEITENQLEVFSNFWINNQSFSNGHGNNRNVQKANGRTIYLHLDEESSSYGSMIKHSIAFLFLNFII